MWTMVVRMLAVFGFWGGALLLAMAGGMPPRAAELVAAGCAGLTLAVMSLVPAPAGEAHASPGEVDHPGGDERRSVS